MSVLLVLVWRAHTGAGSRKHEKTTHAKHMPRAKRNHNHRTNNDFNTLIWIMIWELKLAVADERDTTPGSAAVGGSSKQTHKNKVE